MVPLYMLYAHLYVCASEHTDVVYMWMDVGYTSERIHMDRLMCLNTYERMCVHELMCVYLGALRRPIIRSNGL